MIKKENISENVTDRCKVTLTYKTRLYSVAFPSKSTKTENELKY